MREGGVRRAGEGRGGCAEEREGGKRGERGRRREKRGFSSMYFKKFPAFQKIIYKLYIIYFSKNRAAAEGRPRKLYTSYI